MALDPVEIDRVVLAQLQKAGPQVRVEGGLLVPLHPAPGPPAPGPTLLQGVNDVLAVRVQLHRTGLLQGLQGGDHPGELHAVVGGLGLSPGELLLVGAVHQNRPPAPRAGVARTGPVGVDGYCFHIVLLIKQILSRPLIRPLRGHLPPKGKVLS